MLEWKPSDILMEVGKKSEKLGELVDKDRYQRLVGKLVYTFPRESSIWSLLQNSHIPKGITKQRSVLQEKSKQWDKNLY